MKTTPPQSDQTLTDRPALLRYRARAERIGFADFLHRIAADEVHDRLAEINRTFLDPVIVTGAADFWQAEFPTARVIADTPDLQLTPASADLVIHAMALHWANDPVGQLIQCARALRPDGLLIVACPGGRTLNELRASLMQAEVQISNGLSPRVLPMGEIRDLGALLGRAGLALPVADQLVQFASYRDLLHLAQDLRAMGEVNALSARLRRPSSARVLMRAAQLYAQNHADPDDPARIRATYELVFLTGWAPDPSQQQPLRPGSARMPLADALATTRKTES